MAVVQRHSDSFFVVPRVVRVLAWGCFYLQSSWVLLILTILYIHVNNAYPLLPLLRSATSAPKALLLFFAWFALSREIVFYKVS